MENTQFKRTGKDLKTFTFTARPVLSQVNNQVLPPPALNPNTMLNKNFPIKPFIFLDDSEKTKESQKLTSACLDKLEETISQINPVKCQNPVNFNQICENIQKDLQNLDQKRLKIMEKSEEEALKLNSEILKIRSEVSETDENIQKLLEKKSFLDNILKDYQQTIKMFQSLTLIDIQEIYEGQDKYRAVAGKKDKTLEFLLEREENGEYLYEFLSSNLNNLDDLPIWKSRASFEYRFLKDFYLSLVEKISS